MSNTHTADLTLYFAPRTRSFAALWLLEELGAPFQLESFDFATGRHKQADYLALNPMGKVPLVMDGETAVPEIGAMAIYLADRYGTGGFAPALTEDTRAAYLRWMFFASAIMEPAFAQKLFAWEVSPATVAWGSFEQMMDVLADGLADGPWLLGETFTAADVVVGNNLVFGQMIGIIPQDGPIGEYLARLKTREAFQRAEAIEVREGERFPVAAE
ncbi:glutathione S-transferase family protein [uncultured Shimia sp.]|uniref:glutathione S-transferase family protein n=1 Tax=uncultured Shimia sp. TaxID=573152 RepID=UPI0025EE10A5|nr:glutathione S-transferase family protein [uncultured Shimia sp.]